MRSILNGRFNINPVKKRFDRLTPTANSGIETITRTQRIIHWSFMRNKNVHIPSFLEKFCSGRIRVSAVSKQTAV